MNKLVITVLKKIGFSIIIIIVTYVCFFVAGRFCMDNSPLLEVAKDTLGITILIAPTIILCVVFPERSQKKIGKSLLVGMTLIPPALTLLLAFTFVRLAIMMPSTETTLKIIIMISAIVFTLLSLWLLRFVKKALKKPLDEFDSTKPLL